DLRNRVCPLALQQRTGCERTLSCPSAGHLPYAGVPTHAPGTRADQIAGTIRAVVRVDSDLHVRPVRYVRPDLRVAATILLQLMQDRRWPSRHVDRVLSVDLRARRGIIDVAVTELER